MNSGESDRTKTHPPACPACGSLSVTTTAKQPDASSYLRCEKCGEIWNVGRRVQASARPRNAWR